MAEAVVSAVGAGDTPVVDIASGRGFLVERLAKALDRPIVATDFSPTVLRRTRERFRRQGLADRVSFLAVDARCTPFADGSLPILTTYVGLENIGDSSAALTELRRVTGGALYWVATFYDDGDPNESAIRELGSTLSLRSDMQRTVRSAGWTPTTIASSHARVVPTPHGEVVDAGIDGIPVRETTAEWAALRLS
jgi:ubiquinone/menaquinone biosynthesis C-methylase UbiE